MSNAIVSYDVRSLIDRWMEQEQNGEQFPVDLDIAWGIPGYADKGKAKRRLTSKSSHLIEGIDYKIDKGVPLTRTGKSELSGRSSDKVVLTCDAFKQLCLIAETEEGRQIRQYFIEAEKKWSLTQKLNPEVAQLVELEKLRLEIEREKNLGKQLDSTMLQLHGDRVVLALRGCQDVIVEKETVVTEVIEADTGKSTKFLSADQLKRAVFERTGQKLKSLKHFSDALRKEGRDDLLIPVRRSNVSEYIAPDKLDEAINIVYGKQRQQLIGQ